MGDHLVTIKTAALNDGEKSFGSYAPAGTKVAGNGFMCAEQTVISGLQQDLSRKAQQVGNTAVHVNHTHSLRYGAFIPTSDKNGISIGTAEILNNLFLDVTVFIIEDLLCAVILCELNAARSAAHGKDTACTAKCRASDRHEANRAGADHNNGIAELDVSHLNGAEAGGNHIGSQNTGSNGNTLGNSRKVHVCKGDTEIFAENSVVTQGSESAAGLTAGMHVPAFLNLRGQPVRSNAGNGNDFTDLNVGNQTANLNDTTDCLVSKNDVGALLTSFAYKGAGSIGCARCV